MHYIVGIIVPIILLTVGLWYSFTIHKKYLLMWRQEFRFRDMFYYIVPTLFKSGIIMTLIIIIHNSYHSSHYEELILFVLVFFVFSIIQSPYSLSGFLTRSKHIYYNSKSFFKDKSERADRFIHKIEDIFRDRGQIVVKILVFTGFIIVFIPNITLFVTSNILYFLLIFLLVALSLVLNNIIYFGFVSLMIFQYDPVSLTFANINWIVLILSYLPILLGLSLENRFERKMFFLITIMEVKKFNFKLGYETIFNTRRIVVYQNMVNHYYYVYFRNVGLVVVLYSDFDLKLSKSVLTKCVKEAKNILNSSPEYN